MFISENMDGDICLREAASSNWQTDLGGLCEGLHLEGGSREGLGKIC